MNSSMLHSLELLEETNKILEEENRQLRNEKVMLMNSLRKTYNVLAQMVPCFMYLFSKNKENELTAVPTIPVAKEQKSSGPGTIYLLLVPALIDDNLYLVIKTGRTVNIKTRMSSYPIGTIILNTVQVENMSLNEKQLSTYMKSLALKNKWVAQRREYWHAGYTTVQEWQPYTNDIMDYMTGLE